MEPLRCSHRKTFFGGPPGRLGRLATDVAHRKLFRGTTQAPRTTGDRCGPPENLETFAYAQAAVRRGGERRRARPWPPLCRGRIGTKKRRTTKPHERLVSVSSTPCSAYTSDLSTSSSSTALQGVAPGRPSLEVCFPLRCFQRLSDPDTATQRCHWRDNWYTGGPSNPVLSY